MEQDDQTGVIYEILPRENYIVRESPRKKYTKHILAANLDQAFLLATVRNPNIKLGFMDRFLVACEAYHVPAVILFNKTDLLKEKDKIKLVEVEKAYALAGYPIISISALTGENVALVKEKMKDKITLVAGHSGVGKTTFINRISPTLNLKTAQLSNYSGKGQHTTTFATMYPLPFGGFIVDTPGIKELTIMDIEPSEVSHYFPEMRSRLQQCQFNNCLHINEPGCAVKDALDRGEIAISRYLNYLTIVDEINKKNPWEYT